MPRRSSRRGRVVVCRRTPPWRFDQLVRGPGPRSVRAGARPRHSRLNGERRLVQLVEPPRPELRHDHGFERRRRRQEEARPRHRDRHPRLGAPLEEELRQVQRVHDVGRLQLVQAPPDDAGVAEREGPRARRRTRRRAPAAVRSNRSSATRAGGGPPPGPRRSRTSAAGHGRRSPGDVRETRADAIRRPRRGRRPRLRAGPRRQTASRHSRSPAPARQAASVAVSAAARHQRGRLTPPPAPARSQRRRARA